MLNVYELQIPLLFRCESRCEARTVGEHEEADNADEDGGYALDYEDLAPALVSSDPTHFGDGKG